MVMAEGEGRGRGGLDCVVMGRGDTATSTHSTNIHLTLNPYYPLKQ